MSVYSTNDWHYLDGGLCRCISKCRTAWLIVGGVPTAHGAQPRLVSSPTGDSITLMVVFTIQLFTMDRGEMASGMREGSDSHHPVSPDHQPAPAKHELKAKYLR